MSVRNNINTYKYKYIRLFCNFCMSFYGCTLWSFFHKDLNNFDVAWRKAIRRIWLLPYRTHNNFIPFFVNGIDFRSILYSRFVNFAHSCLQSSNCCISFIVRVASNSCLHNFGLNFCYCNFV